MLNRVYKENLSHPMIAEEERLLRILGLLERITGQRASGALQKPPETS